MFRLTQRHAKRTTSLLLLLYAVGALGIASPYGAQFLVLTPLLLLLTAALLLLHHQQPWRKAFVAFCLITTLLSFAVEVIGVHTGQVFGTYHYGPHLGWQLGGVPLLIGLNWLLLVYAVGNMLAPQQHSPLHKSLLGAALLTAMDGLMEPIATHLHFWHWDGPHVPWQNYGAWYLLAWALLLLFYRTHAQPHNPIGKVVYLTLLTFFGLLRLLLQV